MPENRLSGPSEVPEPPADAPQNGSGDLAEALGGNGCSKFFLYNEEGSVQA